MVQYGESNGYAENLTEIVFRLPKNSRLGVAHLWGLNPFLKEKKS